MTRSWLKICLLLALFIVVVPIGAEEGVIEVVGSKENAVVNPIRVNHKNLKLEAYRDVRLDYTIEGNASSVVFASSNPDVATVSENGWISTRKPGEAVITIQAVVEGETFTETVQVVVLNPVKTGSLKFEFNAIYLNRGGDYKLNYTLSNESIKTSDIIWNTSNADVATIKNGVVTGHSEGVAIISATIGGEVSSIEVKVIVPLEEVAFNPRRVSVMKNESIPIPDLVYVPYDSTEIEKATYTVADDSVVAIEKGRIKGLKVGKTRVSAIVGKVMGSLEVEVLPEANEAGAQIATLVVDNENDKELRLKVPEISKVAQQGFALYYPKDEVIKAVAEGKSVVVTMPQRFFDRSLNLVQSFNLDAAILASIDTNPLNIRIEDEANKQQVGYKFTEKSNQSVNLNYELKQVSNEQKMAYNISGRAYEIDFMDKTLPQGMQVTIPSAFLQSSPSQMHFVYAITDNEVAKESQDVKVSKDGTLTFTPSAQRNLVTFNKMKKSGDTIVIWVLAGVLVSGVVGLGIFSFKRYKNKQEM